MQRTFVVSQEFKHDTKPRKREKINKLDLNLQS